MLAHSNLSAGTAARYAKLVLFTALYALTEFFHPRTVIVNATEGSASITALLLAISTATFPQDNHTEYTVHVVTLSVVSGVLVLILLNKFVKISVTQWEQLHQVYFP